MKRIKMFNCPMDIATMQETVNYIKTAVSNKKFTQHVVVNVAKLVNMRKDRKLAESVTQCDMINIDGMGVVWGARFLGYKVPERVAGVDLFFHLNAMAEEMHFPVFYLGARQEVVKKTAHIMQEKHPQLMVAGYHHGYFWEDEKTVVKKIHDSGARLLFVAITSPKKENFINQWKDTLGVDFVMGVGGTFDVIAGKTKRAPEWMQQWGLEWFYRLTQEPGRMWKRYLFTNIAFLFLVLKAKLGERNLS